MVCLPGLDSKSYEPCLGGGVVPPVRCPDPQCGGALLRGHGWYPRYLAGVQQRFRRLRCPQCGVSHGVLPEDVCAYRDALLVELEAGLEAQSASVGARAAGQSGACGVRRVRGWRRSQKGDWVKTLLALLPAAEGAWWQRVRIVFGPAAGWLLRLRRWLWQSYCLLFSGLSGLWRGGRPRWRPPAASTDFGISLGPGPPGKMLRHASG